MKQRHLIHLHWRSGFGIKPSSLHSAKALNKKKNVNSIFESSKKIEPIQIDLSEFDDFLKTPYQKYKKIHGADAATIAVGLGANPVYEQHTQAAEARGGDVGVGL